MVADTAADMEVHIVADTEVDKVADMAHKSIARGTTDPGY